MMSETNNVFNASQALAALEALEDSAVANESNSDGSSLGDDLEECYVGRDAVVER